MRGSSGSVDRRWRRGGLVAEDERRKERMSDEDRAWLESDLSGLSDFEPYEWAEGELEAGDPIRCVPGGGAVAGGEES